MSIPGLPNPPGVHYCALCECPLPIGSTEVVCGACVTEWQRWGDLTSDMETGKRTDWLTHGVSHINMQRRRQGPISRHWEFEVSEINDSISWEDKGNGK